MNAIGKLAGSERSSCDADMFITHAPCIDCAKLIFGAGIRDVFYRYKYKDDLGLNFLNKCNIKTEQV
jgi:dCMP deaminase